MAAAARENPAVGRYALLLAEGFAVDPDLADPTGVLAAAFADLAAPLIADGVRRYYLLHTALPRLSEALSNLGFGRRSAYGIQPAAPRRGSSAVAVRIAGAGDLETIARLALVEIQHRSAPPMFAPRQDHQRSTSVLCRTRPSRLRRMTVVIGSRAHAAATWYRRRRNITVFVGGQYRDPPVPNRGCAD